MERTLNQEVYDPVNRETDAKLPNTIEEILREKDGEEIPTRKLAKQVEKKDLFTWQTARSKLYYAKEDVQEQAKVNVRKRKGGEGGSDTLMWRYIE